jgi:mono/diheme cytochrome c family protein
MAASRSTLFVAALLGVPLSLASAEELPPASTAIVDFAKDIQPLLRKNCYSCHGAEHQEGGLRLDQRKRALDGGDSGAEIVPGKSAESRLVRMIAGIDDDFGRMPPESKGTALTDEQVGLVRAWIDQGAKWPDDALAQNGSDHWSLRAVVRPALPSVNETDWLREPIDAFILVRLEREKLVHSPPAEKTTLLRRLHLDLIGLLPTPDEVETFLADERPDASERLVDRLLASPHFGERWGRHWLDLARYADSDGYEKDRPRPFAWKYRDWVIAAINADLPYDQFTLDQLAGDFLPNATDAQRTASGLHRNTLHNTEGGIDPEEDRVKKTIDRTNTLGAVWLGLTVGCAQCHTHKYDPITQREYYQLFAFFNSLDEKDLERPTPEQAAKHEAATKAHAEQLSKLKAGVEAYVAEKLAAAQLKWEESLAASSAEALAEKKIPAAVAAALSKPRDQRTPDEAEQIAKHYRTLDAELIKLEKAVKDQQAKPPQLPDDAKVQSVAELAQPRATKILLRGDFLNPGEPVQRATLAVLPALKPRGDMADRVDLARWVVDSANPLTSRVAVNRHWHQLFGRGIVPTLDDFGKQGEKPSHPELLDYLASEFSAGWSNKAIIRRIVSSAAYQQSSAPRADLHAVDPENVLVARQSRRRVESEVIRDLALAASGLIVPQIGGPSVRPPQPAEYATLTYAGSAKWAESSGADRYRRGMYTFFQRTSPYPMLMTFDSPDSNECTARRQTSNTPLQALTLWNDPAFVEAAQTLGRRIVADVPGEGDRQQTARPRAERAFLLCLARRPSSAEFDDVLSLYEASRELASRDGSVALQILGAPPPTSQEDLAEQAAWVSVGRALLNLDEFITRE